PQYVPTTPPYPPTSPYAQRLHVHNVSLPTTSPYPPTSPYAQRLHVHNVSLPTTSPYPPTSPYTQRLHVHNVSLPTTSPCPTVSLSTTSPCQQRPPSTTSSCPQRPPVHNVSLSTTSPCPTASPCPQRLPDPNMFLPHTVHSRVIRETTRASQQPSPNSQGTRASSPTPSASTQTGLTVFRGRVKARQVLVTSGGDPGSNLFKCRKSKRYFSLPLFAQSADSQGPLAARSSLPWDPASVGADREENGINRHMQHVTADTGSVPLDVQVLEVADFDEARMSHSTQLSPPHLHLTPPLQTVTSVMERVPTAKCGERVTSNLNDEHGKCSGRNDLDLTDGQQNHSWIFKLQARWRSGEY
ncbi:hypothetical protein BaRGS_00013432, partial [Batillaria attramentaria]